jgi:hypothetical protein
MYRSTVSQWYNCIQSVREWMVPARLQTRSNERPTFVQRSLAGTATLTLYESRWYHRVCELSPTRDRARSNALSPASWCWKCTEADDTIAYPSSHLRDTGVRGVLSHRCHYFDRVRESMIRPHCQPPRCEKPMYKQCCLTGATLLAIYGS